MDISRQEEIIATLWIIAALIAFGNGFETWGWACAIKGGLDTAIAILFAIKEAIAELKAKAHNAALSGSEAVPLESTVMQKEG